VVYVQDNQTIGADSDSGANGIAGYVVDIVDDTEFYVSMGPHIAGQIVIAASEASQLDTAQTEIQAIEDHLLTAQYHIPTAPVSGWAADGGPMVAWVDGSVNGLELTGSELQGYRFGPVGEDTSVISTTVALPADLDTAEDLVVHLMGARVGAADTTMVLAVGAFFQTAAAAYDADADAGGNTAAIAEATTLMTEKTVTIAAADVPATPCLLTLTIAPDAALDADDYVLGAVWLEGTRKLLTS